MTEKDEAKVSVEADGAVPSPVLDEPAARTVEETARLLTAFTDSMTPETLSSLMALVSQLAELADRLAKPELAGFLDRLLPELPTLERLLERVERMEKDGGLARVEELLGFLGTALSATTPELVGSLAGTLSRLLDVADLLMQSEIFRQLPAALADVDHVLREPPRHQPRGELRHLMARLRDPDLQDGLELALEVLSRAGRGAREEAARRGRPVAAAPAEH
ncbi:MAG: hypothetical protein QJR14_00070 [Bacillota bacterium]|nr:hypothetical protein [Bacillota bacterium]